ncbi:MAG: hypothetical protein WCJ71_09510, partial [Candidatus Omnitrophota bacterium]
SLPPRLHTGGNDQWYHSQDLLNSLLPCRRPFDILCPLTIRLQSMLGRDLALFFSAFGYNYSIHELAR